MSRKQTLVAVLVLGLAILIMSACGSTEEVTRIVKETVVEKETIVETVVEKETVIVEGTPEVKEVEVTKEVVKEVVVTATSEAMEEPDEEKVLHAVVGKRTADWSPLRGGGWHHDYFGIQYAYPFYLDAENQLQPYVFTEWEPNDDFTVWTFKVDERAVFSDGSPITAEEVVGSWNLGAHPLSQNQRIDLFFSNVEGYEEVVTGEVLEMTGLKAVDEQTVEVTLQSPDPIYYQRLASQFIPVVKVSQARGPDGAEVPEWWLPENGVVVSGPYMPDRMDLDALEFEFVPNPNFWLGEPQLDRIIVYSIEDYGVIETMVLNGELDRGASCTPEFAPKMPPEYCEGVLNMRMHNFWFSTVLEPTNDINVRKALVMAIDRDELYEVVYPTGMGALEGEQILPPPVPGHDPDWEPYPYDCEAAKEALAASPYGSAENLPKIRMVGISSDENKVAAQYIAESWRTCLGIQEVEFHPAYDDFSGPDQERLQIKRDDVATRVMDPVVYLMGAIHSSSGNAQRKMDGYSNPEIDRLLEEASTKQADDPDRIRLAQEAQRLFREDWMYIPWMYEMSLKQTQPYVKNWIPNIDLGLVEPWKITIEK